MFKNLELYKLVIISLILMTLMFDSGVILYGEIRSWSLLRVKGLREMQKPHSQHAEVCVKRSGLENWSGCCVLFFSKAL